MKLAISLLVGLAILCLATTSYGADSWEKFDEKATVKSFGKFVGVKVIPFPTPEGKLGPRPLVRDSIWTSNCVPERNPWDKVYTFFRGDCIEFVCAFMNWPGGDIIQDIGIWLPGAKYYKIFGILYEGVSEGNWWLMYRVEIPNNAPIGRYDWATRIAGSTAGWPLGNPPQPFHIVGK